MTKDKEKVLIVAQEIHFAKALAANDKQLRERALRRLNKWLSIKSKSSLEFTEDGFMRIWKGLFYLVWMSDKPLIQEDTVESISQLIHCFTKFQDALSFVRCFYQSMSQAWFGLDQHRLDKYMMLVRRFVRQTFICLRKSDWNKDNVHTFSEDFYKALTQAPVGFIMHLADVYIVELSKVGEGKLKSETVVELVRPWAKLLASESDVRLINAIKRHVFLYLIRQSDLALSHSAKFDAWRKSGFPGGDIEMMEQVEASSSDVESDSDADAEVSGEVILDPRAGRADTILPPVEFQAKDMVHLLHTTKVSSSNSIASRQSKSLTALIDKFKELERGKYPLGLHRVELPPNDDSSSEDEVDKAIHRLSRFEDDLFKENRKRKAKDPIQQGRRRDSSGSVWDVSDSTSEPAGISLLLSPHSLASSPWTVEENGQDDLEPAQIKKRRVPANSADSQRTPNRVGKSSVKEGAASISEASPFLTPYPKRSKFSIQNGEGCKEPTSSKNGSIEITLTKLTPSGKRKSSSPTHKKILTPSSEKKVAFVLSRNQSQEAHEYVKSVENSPRIPYDASKKPGQGVLKASAIASPINPFYMSNCRRKRNKRSI